MSEFESFLKNFDKPFSEAAAPDNSLPDGKYQASIDRIYIKPNKNGELALRIEFNIVNSVEFAGRKSFYYKTISQDFIGYVKADLKAIGIEPEPFSKVESYFKDVLDKVVEITLKTSHSTKTGQDYQNLYIQKLVGDLPKQASKPAAKSTPVKNTTKVQAAAASTPDDLPF